MKSPRPATLVLATSLIVATLSLTSCKNGTGNGGVTTPVARELDSGNIAGGSAYVHTFANAGTFGYHCTIHGTGMAGTVTVVAGGAASAAVAIGNNFYNPASVSVAPGGTVTWTNGGSTHTVTSN